MRQLQAARESEAQVNPNWDWIYQRHAPEIQRYLRRLLRTDDEAAEITQETFARAVGASRQPDTLEGMQPWLFRIATNLALSRLRRRRLVSWIPFSGRELVCRSRSIGSRTRSSIAALDRAGAGGGPRSSVPSRL